MRGKIIKALIKVLMGIPGRMEILGFFDGKPILHDPENPVPEGIVYFINKDTFKRLK